MTQDKINLKRAMDALEKIAILSGLGDSPPDDGRDMEDVMEEIGLHASIAIRQIESRQNRDMHMGAPGGDRSLLPECQCCGEGMTVGDKEYECFACGNRINKEAWGKRVKYFLDGKL